MATARMRVLFVWLTLCALWTLATGAFAAPFTSPEGYQLTAPDSWKVVYNTEGADVSITSPPANGGAGNFNITISPGPPATADQIREQFDNIKNQFHAMYVQGHPDVQFVSQNQSAIDSTPALDSTFIYTDTVPNVGRKLMRIRQVIAFRPGKTFTFTCTTFEAAHVTYDATFDRIINSLHWTDSAGQTAAPAATSATPGSVFHSTKGYQITLPNEWENEASKINGTDLSLVKPLPIGAMPRLRLTVDIPKRGSTLDTWQKSLSIVLPRDLPHYLFVSQDFFMLDGVRALGTKFTNINKSGQMLFVREIDVYKNGQRYSLVFAVPYETHADYDETFTDIMKSFHWTH